MPFSVGFDEGRSLMYIRPSQTPTLTVVEVLRGCSGRCGSALGLGRARYEICSATNLFFIAAGL